MKKRLALGALTIGLIAVSIAGWSDEITELTLRKTETIDPETKLKRGVREEYLRGESKVVTVMHLYKEGKLASSSRFTYAFERMILQEGDLDGDGFFELRVIFPNDDPNSVEVFHVEKDGTLKPASAAKTKDYRQHAKELDDLGKMMREEIEKAKQDK